MNENEQKLIALSDLLGQMVCGDGPAPTWNMIDERNRLQALLGKRWDWVGRCWRDLPESDA